MTLIIKTPWKGLLFVVAVFVLVTYAWLDNPGNWESLALLCSYPRWYSGSKKYQLPGKPIGPKQWAQTIAQVAHYGAKVAANHGPLAFLNPKTQVCKIMAQNHQNSLQAIILHTFGLQVPGSLEASEFLDPQGRSVWAGLMVFFRRSAQAQKAKWLKMRSQYTPKEPRTR